MHYLAICAIFRDEAPYLAEWICFHRINGAEHFYLYDNGSTDDPERELKPFIDQGLVTLLEWAIPFHERAQNLAYAHCLARVRKQNTTRWLAFIDIDEFLFSPVSYRLADELQAFEEFPGVVVHWQVYGSNDQIEATDAPVIARFTRRAPTGWIRNRKVKSIVDPARAVAPVGVHHFSYESGALAVDETMRPVRLGRKPNYKRRFKRWFALLGPLLRYFDPYPGRDIRSRRISVERLRINHYPVKSRQEFQNKARHKKEKRRYEDLDYFAYHDRNEVFDPILHRYLPDLLSALERPAISALPTYPSIAYCLRHFPGASQTFVLNELLALERLGIAVEVFSLLPAEAPPLSELAPDSRIKTRYFPGAWRRLGDLLWASFRYPGGLLRALAVVVKQPERKRLLSLIRATWLLRRTVDTGVRHYHAHFGTGTEVLLMAHLIAGIAYSFTAHAREIYTRKRLLTEKLSHARFVVTVCDYNRRLLADALSPEHSVAFHIVKPVLNLARFTPDTTSGVPGDPGSPLAIATVCRLVKKKGVDVLLHALEGLRRRGVRINASIIGDGPERGPLEHLIRQLGLGDKVELLGARDPRAVRSLLAAADIFVLASVRTADQDSDATPTVLGEAMAMGLPVVSTRLAGIPEIVPEDAGLLVEPGDASALAAAIQAIHNLSPEARRAMGDAGRAFVHANWNPDLDAARLATLFARGSADGSAATPGRVAE